MICEKDVEDGNAFWAAAVASKVILPNGEEAERKTCKVSGWYLLDTDDEYWLLKKLEGRRIVKIERGA